MCWNLHGLGSAAERLEILRILAGDVDDEYCGVKKLLLPNILHGASAGVRKEALICFKKWGVDEETLEKLNR